MPILPSKASAGIFTIGAELPVHGLVPMPKRFAFALW